MQRYRDVRRWTYELFAPTLGGDLGRRVDLVIMALIVVNVTAVILETVDWIAAAGGAFFWYFEVVSVVIFTIEYLGRIWSAIEDGTYVGPVTGRLKFASKPLLVVDLLAILPFYLALTGLQIDLRFLRALRLLRLFRLLKLVRYSTALKTFVTVFRDKKEMLVMGVVTNGLLLTLASSAMYYVEHPHQPEVFSSIPAAFYWGFITLTTVGYGDVTPVTPLGRLFTGVIAMLGVGLFALPASILASGFIKQAADDCTEGEYCPHCGERIDK